ncbi:MAG: energy transducer TonB [Gammaproteobacteria bacterium]
MNTCGEVAGAWNPTERLIVALLLALAFHATVLFGMTFAPTDKGRSHSNTLDIVLVQHRSDAASEEVDFLAQANQQGGGQQPDRARPTTPFKAPFINSDAAVALASRPRREPAVEAALPATLSQPLMTADDAIRRQWVTEQPPASAEARVVEPAPERVPPADDSRALEAIDAEALVSRSLAMASLSAELDEKLEAYAKRPRRKFVSANTREYKYASYMEAWRTKVERIGNLNYPDEARRRQLSGSLRLGVAVNADGTLNAIALRRSSGHKVLDEAAIRIVELAAPFAPFPDDIRKDTDILHIERTWQFLRNNRLASQ